jgi:hypothetical protein
LKGLPFISKDQCLGIIDRDRKTSMLLRDHLACCSADDALNTSLISKALHFTSKEKLEKLSESKKVKLEAFAVETPIIETNQFLTWLSLTKHLVKLVRVLLTEYQTVELKFVAENAFKMAVPREQGATIGRLLSLL